jgi:hypothetical protein
MQASVLIIVRTMTESVTALYTPSGSLTAEWSKRENSANAALNKSDSGLLAAFRAHEGNASMPSGSSISNLCDKGVGSPGWWHCCSILSLNRATNCSPVRWFSIEDVASLVSRRSLGKVPDHVDLDDLVMATKHASTAEHDKTSTAPAG